jgi:hypothetical protein
VIRYTIQQVVDLCFENTKSVLFKVSNKIQFEESTQNIRELDNCFTFGLWI